MTESNFEKAQVHAVLARTAKDLAETVAILYDCNRTEEADAVAAQIRAMFPEAAKEPTAAEDVSDAEKVRGEELHEHIQGLCDKYGLAVFTIG